MKLGDLLRRPQVEYARLAPFDPERPNLPDEVTYEAEVQIKYEGYIKRQLTEASRMAKLSEKKLPSDLDYQTIEGLRLEARQKLNKIRPADIGQASRISGVSPADISVLLIYLKMGE
jgi:tRNA uridine 5-carboxymethylaminomethyl modification enzyme